MCMKLSRSHPIVHITAYNITSLLYWLSFAWQTKFRMEEGSIISYFIFTQSTDLSLICQQLFPPYCFIQYTAQIQFLLQFDFIAILKAIKIQNKYLCNIFCNTKEYSKYLGMCVAWILAHRSFFYSTIYLSNHNHIMISQSLRWSGSDFIHPFRIFVH